MMQTLNKCKVVLNERIDGHFLGDWWLVWINRNGTLFVGADGKNKGVLQLKD